jgi:polysaccharide biosynthesis/export protein
MRIIFKKIDFRLFFLGIIVLWMSNCVPIRKTIVVRDKSLLTLKQIHEMDTIVSVVPYVYKIRKGDILTIEIINTLPSAYTFGTALAAGADVGAGYLVNDSGFVELPILGLVQVEGKSLVDCRKNIKKIASEYLNNIDVKVNLQNFRVTVIGEKGGVAISPDGNLSVLEAIAQLGGFTDMTNIENVRIIRKIEGENKIHSFYIDVSDIGIISKPEYFLQPNDILVFEPRRIKNIKNVRIVIGYFSLMLSTFFLIYSLGNRFK